MNFDKMHLANTFALTTAILWIACSAFVALLPDLSLVISNWWMHGLDVSVLGTWDMNLYGVTLGGITLTISAWIAGLVLGWSGELLSGKGN